MILRNHGLLTCAETVADAFLDMYILQKACEVQIRAQAGGGELIPIPKPIIDGIQKNAKIVMKQSGRHDRVAGLAAHARPRVTPAGATEVKPGARRARSSTEKGFSV